METTNQQNQTSETSQPSREQIVQWYRDEIELAALRAELSQLQRDATVAEAERLNALGAIAQMTQKPEDGPKRTLKKEPVESE